MFSKSNAFSGFSADDIPAAKTFYADTLGLEVGEQNGMLNLSLATGGAVLVYPKDDHEPAGFTVLNFPVDDIDAAVDALAEKGVEMTGGEGTDERGVFRGADKGMGPNIAWFTDPAGNVLSILEIGD